MEFNTRPEGSGQVQELQLLIEQLRLRTGLLIVSELSQASQKGTPIQLKLKDFDSRLFLVWEEQEKPSDLVVRLISALAQEMYDELRTRHGKNGVIRRQTWEGLMNEAYQQQWNSEEFSHYAQEYRLPPLEEGLPVYIHCVPYHSEIPEVLANLYPQAQVCWVQEPDLFLWLPSGGSGFSERDLKLWGEVLIQEVYSLLADELGVSTSVLVGEPQVQNVWAGYLEVKKLLTIQQRFFAGEPGITSWKLGLALLFTPLKNDEARRYEKRVLGELTAELIDTLDRFLEHDLSIGETAKALFIHRNTLIYRLDRITEITGYNPRRLKNAVYFYLAVWLRKHLKA